ncbi:MAG: type II toxin-antitoxin system RelE/ParE family toxin [Coriobacteriia bacterium]|nr:type II toxin-antitoxin system RelE/ParE family toxin [Coriobacteriia bacterium]
MIVSFADKATEDLFHNRASVRSREYSKEMKRIALRKLDVLNAAHSLADLRSLSGNRLEPLRGDFKGIYSIRINDQWRLVFRLEDSNAYDVQILDYH